MNLNQVTGKPASTIMAVGLLALSLAACGNESGEGDSGAGKLVDGRTFTMALPSDPGDLDPHMTSAGGAFLVNRFVYDSLINIDKSGKEVAGLSSEWTQTPTSVTYTLRDGVTCADGAALKATDVAANINFVGDPANMSSRIGIYVPVGASATADDAAGTVTVTSTKPEAFLARSVGTLPIVCAGGLEDRKSLAQGASGTGMFELTEVVANDHYTLTRRKDYAWGPGEWKVDQPGLPDKVVLKIVPNESTAANLLLSGEINASSIGGPDKKRLEAQKLFSRASQQPLGELWFNQKPGTPGADEAVRRALTQALDLEELAKVMSGGEGVTPTGLIPKGQGPCSIDTVEGSIPASDIEAAKAALDESGWAAGDDGIRAKDGKPLKLDFYYPSEYGAAGEAGAELLRNAWKAVGAETSIKSVTDAQAGTIIVGGQGSWNATILPVAVDQPSMLVPFLSGPTPPNGTNFGFIDNADYTEHAGKAAGIPGTDGCEEWAAAEKALFEQSDVVPFYNSVSPVFGKGAEFELAFTIVDPTSIRMVG